MRLAAVLVEAARAEALRVRVVHHDVRRDVPGEIAAALVAGFGVGEIRRVEVEARAAPASAGPHACLEATERRQHAAGHGVVEAEMPRPGRDRQHLRDQVVINRGEESQLFRVAHLILVEGSVVALHAGIHYRRVGERADVRLAAGVAVARRARCGVGGTGRSVLVQPGALGLRSESRGGALLDCRAAWSYSLLSSQDVPAIARARQSSGVLSRSSCCWCVLRSVACQIALGEKQADNKLYDQTAWLYKHV